MWSASIPETTPVERRRREGRGATPRSRLLFNWFAGYSRRYFAKHFHALRVAGSSPEPFDGRPVVVYLNHPSWWDPITCVVLATHFFPERIHFAPIDERQLGRYAILKRIGFFGVDGQSRRGASDFLRQSEAVLSDSRAMLWVTAQGEFADPRRRPTELRPGVAHLARRLGRGVLLPLALEYPFWHERTPEALARFGEPIDLRGSAGATVAEWNERLRQQLEEAQDALAHAALSRDPARFTSIVGGKAGVGGVYDAWRRATAFLTGRPFVAEHGG